MDFSAVLVNGSQLRNQNQLTTDHYRQILTSRKFITDENSPSTETFCGSVVDFSAVLVNGSELRNQNQLTTDHYRQVLTSRKFTTDENSLPKFFVGR